MDLGVPRYAENVPFIEINDRGDFPQPLLSRIRIFEEVDRKWIDVEVRNGWQALKRGCRTGEALRIHIALPYFVLVRPRMANGAARDRAKHRTAAAPMPLLLPVTRIWILVGYPKGAASQYPRPRAWL